MEKLNQNWRSGRLLIWAGFLAICLVFAGVTYVRCGVWKNGETLWSDVITKYPMKDSRPYACRGLYYRTENQSEKALADFTATLELDKNNTEIRLMRGNIYFDQGKDDSAYSDYIQVLKVTMDNPLALGNLGAILIRRNKPDSAVYYLTRAIAIDSGVAVTFANRAVAHGRMGRIEESIGDFKSFLRIEPDNERVLMSIAIAYQNSARFQESLEWFDKAIAKKPDFGNYYYFRSHSHKQLGNRERALADGVKARDLGAPVPEEYINALR
jgi:tetratricopeptide (TPR) repeat protein